VRYQILTRSAVNDSTTVPPRLTVHWRG
jgi:hypothetical protein